MKYNFFTDFFIFFTIISLFVFNSCSKENINISGSDDASVKINISGLQYRSDSDLLAKNSKNENKDQIYIQRISDNMYIEGLLTTNNIQDRLNSSKESTSINTIAAKYELKENIKYQLLVYRNNDLVASQEYSYKQETDESAIPLYSNVEYTFVIVSERSESTVPIIENIEDLNKATISEVNANLLYWSKKMKLNKGLNFLNAILDPKFCEVTTTLKMDNNMTGYINGITAPEFGPIASHVTLKLSDGTTTFGQNSTVGQPIVFPSIPSQGTRSITSNTTAVVQNIQNNGVFRIAALDADGQIKPVEFKGLSFLPGHRYNLILTLKTCTEEVTGTDGLNWTYEEVQNENGDRGIRLEDNTFLKTGQGSLTREYTENGADYGFIFDIYELDNAFNLEVNGVKMADQEVQFQSDAYSSAQNIEFEDGSQYEGINTEGGSNIRSIYRLKGTKENPLIRILISRNGEVTMLGSKRSGGPLYTLRLKNGNFFNQFTWFPGNTQNKVKVTQLVDGRTVIIGYGSGKRNISCNQ